MSRATILASVAADIKQARAFDSTEMAENLTEIIISAVRAALENPAWLVLGSDGISQLERDVADLAFQEIVSSLWPAIVVAYKRGAHLDEAEELPSEDELLDYDADRLTDLLDGLHMTGLREVIHGKAWALASWTLGRARHVVSLGGTAE